MTLAESVLAQAVNLPDDAVHIIIRVVPVCGLGLSPKFYTSGKDVVPELVTLRKGFLDALALGHLLVR